MTCLSDFRSAVPDLCYCNYRGSCSTMFPTILGPFFLFTLNFTTYFSQFSEHLCFIFLTFDPRIFLLWILSLPESLSSFLSHFHPCQHAISFPVLFSVFTLSSKCIFFLFANRMLPLYESIYVKSNIAHIDREQTSTGWI